MNEFDLPCTDCGTALIESTVPARRLPALTTHAGGVTIAVCPECGARYYPDAALEELTTGTRDQRHNNHV